MNKAIMSGRLTKDPEIRYAQGKEGNMAIAHFSIAVERRFKRQGDPEADFFEVTSFGKQAEFIEKYFKKGNKIIVEGRFQNDNYTNKEGLKVYRTVIIAEALEFGESAPKDANGNTAPAQGNDKAAANTVAPANEGFMDVAFDEDDGLPFT